MQIERITSEGLAHNSYFIADGGVAAVIDPRRDVEVYLDLARYAGARIRWILETHRNEDYVIGSTSLSEATGAEILHSRRLDFEYGTPIAEGDEIDLGRLRIAALETPGHSPDSMTYALRDTETSERDPVMAFTGDALFVGDTGRVDLAGRDEAPRMAETLFHSLFDKILPLGDEVILCPAHGGGSVCGAGISDREFSSLGYERRHNPLLHVPRRAQFIDAKVAELHVRPRYFERMEEWNLRGNAPIYPRTPTPTPLSPAELSEHRRDGVEVVDTRMPQAFAGGHIPGSYSIWLGGLASYLGHVVDPGTRLALVLPESPRARDAVEAAARILFRIGYDEIVGYLRGGIDSWQKDGREFARLDTIDTRGLRERLERGDQLEILDVRQPGEWQSGTIDDARPIFVGELESRAEELPRDRAFVSMCSVGSRGSLGASILARRGFADVATYLGGYSAWKKTARQA